MLMRSPLAVSLCVVSLFVTFAHAQRPDCSALGCHQLAYCEFAAGSTTTSVCVCPPGTIDASSGNGKDCSKKGWRVRYVRELDLGENPSAVITNEAGYARCAAGSQGWYVNSVRGMAEVNCLYASKPTDITAYDALGFEYFTKPAVYTWTLPTTGEALAIPPTGMTVDSVHFEPACAETGCWVLRGVMTTGAAFNTNAAFNTFFLPESDITGISPTGDLSYDFDYTAVDWTFRPANHPCTSAAYMAGSTVGTHEISTCCITDPEAGIEGGFVANYRPTQAFVDWAGELRCSVVFDRDGVKKCWKFYRELSSWDEAAKKCGNVGGKLATIANAAENTVFNQYFTSSPELYEKHVWINLQREDDGSFSWGDGSDYPTDYNWASWFDSYSTLSDPAYATFNCVKMRNDRDGVWINRPCKEENAFMCEFQPPSYDETCVQHVIQRPQYSAPAPARSCWNLVEPQVKQTWEEANATCAALGGTLPVIRDNEENWFLRRFMDWKSLGMQFLAYNDVDNDNAWSWPIDEDTGYTNWQSISQSTNAAKRCSMMTGNAIWRGFNCAQDSTSAGVTCELPRDSSTGTCDSDALQNEDKGWDETFPAQPLSFLDVGRFKGMNASPGVTNLSNLDPFFGQFSFEIKLDEVELRSKAGKLKGTVGVEHTVDTFLGLANFRPTGNKVLDTFATQTNIHLEKTSFFSVSTHGVNEYTFLEYVNMRLVMILNEDADFSGDSEATSRTVRTDPSGNANYVQVTFTMGPQYQPNMLSGGLIPLDSVRAGKGTFFDATPLEHLCTDYEDDDDTTFGFGDFDGEVDDFKTMLGQDCGPKSIMCLSPDTVPDQFVSFNIPLGFMLFDGQPSNTLSNNIFVDFVVNAVDTKARDLDTSPNAGQRPWQMKTTLSASIPIVTGGINVFCDGVTAKTDLKDVANVDIVVGSAVDGNELARLRILEDIASTDLASVQPSTIDTDSIESALMTLVIKGDESYFLTGATNTDDYSMELDDVITLHLMEDGKARTGVASGNGKEGMVIQLLAEAGDDNSDATGLDTDGYKLNGALYFTVNRAAGTASLEPTTALLKQCPFNPPRPSIGSTPLESCILRRDVRLRGYPARTGSVPSAMEILAASRFATGSTDPKDSTAARTLAHANALAETSAESNFLVEILGDSTYTRTLAPNFARAINARYNLNGRFRRAFWINPGYEWTPTQTAGKSIFSVSQKVYLFALISLDENWGTRRRMLLQTASDPLAANSAGVNAASIEYQVTPVSMMAKALNVPIDRVALFDVEMQLTPAEACMDPNSLQNALRLGLADMLADTASAFLTVQVAALKVNMGDEKCAPSRRNIRKLLAGFSTATAEIQMLVVFKEGAVSQFNMDAFAKQPGVNAIEADARNSPKLQLVPILDCSKVACGHVDSNSKSSDASSSSKAALIGGIAGGVAGLLVLVAGAFLVMRRRLGPEPVVTAVQSINVEDLKHQLADEL